MAEYIDTSVNPADYIEVWEAEDAEHGKQLVMAVDDLKSLPPADVRPVVKGHWKEGKVYTWGDIIDKFPCECSVCGRTALDEPWCFCPNCGADMRGAK